MKKLVIAGAATAAAAVTAALLLWPQAGSQAQATPEEDARNAAISRSLSRAPGTGQINADGCSCSRATILGTGRDALAVYQCVCPGIQCVITATQPGATAPPNLIQQCK